MASNHRLANKHKFSKHFQSITM